jgi:hypothetical protein
MLVAALRGRDRQLGLGVAHEGRQIAYSSTEPPLNFNSGRDLRQTAKTDANRGVAKRRRSFSDRIAAGCVPNHISCHHHRLEDT